jgi:hypothetical protein
MIQRYVYHKQIDHDNSANQQYVGITLQPLERARATRFIDHRSSAQFHMVDLLTSLDLR